jgi:signal transduction histidine kinase
LAVDSDKFKQILVNILGNANKFTPERGTIHVHLTQNKKQTTIAISDTGIGIEKKHFEMIFEKFSQVKNHLVRDVSGTGLGLPIAKSLTETMGGTISLKSQIGK